VINTRRDECHPTTHSLDECAVALIVLANVRAKYYRSHTNDARIHQLRVPSVGPQVLAHLCIVDRQDGTYDSASIINAMLGISGGSRILNSAKVGNMVGVSVLKSGSDQRNCFRLDYVRLCGRQFGSIALAFNWPYIPRAGSHLRCG
jgi:hypothetical protein